MEIQQFDATAQDGIQKLAFSADDGATFGTHCELLECQDIILNPRFSYSVMGQFFLAFQKSELHNVF